MRGVFRGRCKGFCFVTKVGVEWEFGVMGVGGDEIVYEIWKLAYDIRDDRFQVCNMLDGYRTSD